MKWLILLDEIVSKAYIEATGGIAIYVQMCVFIMTGLGVVNLISMLINFFKNILT